jgi:hypothetical protein
LKTKFRHRCFVTLIHPHVQLATELLVTHFRSNTHSVMMLVSNFGTQLAVYPGRVASLNAAAKRGS